MIRFKKLYNYFSIIDIVLCIFLGIVFTVYPEYCDNGKFIISTYLVGKGIMLFLIFFILCIIFRILINKLNNINNNRNGLINKLFNKESKVYKYRLFIIAGIIFVFWLPIIIGLYPGTAANDTWGQLNQFAGLFKGEYLYDHHPVFDTLYMGVIIFSIENISKNWEIAFFTYVMIQSIMTSLAFAYSLIYAKEKLELNNFFLELFLIIYAILPIFPASAQSISKDAIFSWIYVLFFINFIEIVRTKGKQLENKKFLIMTIILSIFCCLTKKVGIYILIGSFIFLFICKIDNRKKILSIIIIIFSIMNIIMPILFQIFHISKGGYQEKYSILFQQTARYLKYNIEDVTEDEKKIIEEVLGNNVEKILNLYNERFADPIKGYAERTNRNTYVKYLFVWLKQGLKHPETYIDATNCMLCGWICFEEYKPMMNMLRHSQLDTDIIDESITKRESSAKSAQNIQRLYDKICDIPIIKYLFTPGMYTTVIPLFALATTLRNRKNNNKYWIALIPLFLSIILGCFLSPVSGGNFEGQRYLFPITYTFIIVLMMAIYIEKCKVINE